MSHPHLDVGSSGSIRYAAPETSFIQSTAKRPHPSRRRAILEAHPEVAGLIGYDPKTAAITLAIVIGQIMTASLLGQLGIAYWWMALILAFCIGAFANHALFVIIHDAAHNCIFKLPSHNKWIAILADLPNIFPTTMAFRCYHMKHHSHLGDYNYDADCRAFGKRGSWGIAGMARQRGYSFFQYCSSSALAA